MKAQQVPSGGWLDVGPKAGDIEDRYVEKDGTIWLHQWIQEQPGMLHLVWRIEKKATP